MIDYYKILEIKPNATAEAIKKSYRRLSKLYHPDINSRGTEQFKKINETKQANITKIILQRFFKINSHLINLFVDKLSYNFDQILKFLKRFIIYRALSLSSNDLELLDECDMRRLFLKELDPSLLESYLNLSVFNLDEDKNTMQAVLDKIKDFIK